MYIGGKKGTHKEMLQSAGRNMDGWLHLCSYIINTHNSLGSTKEGRRPKIVIFYPLLCPSHDVTITLLMPLLCPLLADFPSPLDILFNAAQGASIKTSEVWGGGGSGQTRLRSGYPTTYQFSSMSGVFAMPRPPTEVYDTILDSSTHEDVTFLGFIYVVAV